MKIETQKISILDGIELKYASSIGKKFPLHFHEGYSIGILQKGIEYLTIENQKIIVPANSVTVIHPYQTHANSYNNKEAWQYQMLYIGKDALQYVTGNEKNFMPTFENSFQNVELFTFLSAFFGNYALQTEQSVTKIASLLLAFSSKKNEHIYPKYFSIKNKIEDAKQYFQTNCMQKINITQYALTIGLSSFQFIRAFKTHVGVTPISYLIICKLQLAQKLLLQNIPLVEVALECGFYDQSHFTNYFIKYFGVSPLQYKQSIVWQ